MFSVPDKIMAIILFDHIYEALDGRMRDRQASFRGGRSCADHIFVLRNIIEQSVEWQRQLVVNFIDFKKAFDSLHRNSMWKILRSYGLPMKIINMIKLLYEGSKSCVRVGGTNTDYFDITSGVKQGDVLSPILFIVVVDWILRRTVVEENEIDWMGTNRLPELSYVDCIVLQSGDKDSMKRVTEKLPREASKVGVERNRTKTVVMAVQPREDVSILWKVK